MSLNKGKLPNLHGERGTGNEGNRRQGKQGNRERGRGNRVGGIGERVTGKRRVVKDLALICKTTDRSPKTYQGQVQSELFSGAHGAAGGTAQTYLEVIAMMVVAV